MRLRVDPGPPRPAGEGGTAELERGVVGRLPHPPGQPLRRHPLRPPLRQGRQKAHPTLLRSRLPRLLGRRLLHHFPGRSIHHQDLPRDGYGDAVLDGAGVRGRDGGAEDPRDPRGAGGRHVGPRRRLRVRPRPLPRLLLPHLGQHTFPYNLPAGVRVDPGLAVLSTAEGEERGGRTGAGLVQREERCGGGVRGADRDEEERLQGAGGGGELEGRPGDAGGPPLRGHHAPRHRHPRPGREHVHPGLRRAESLADRRGERGVESGGARRRQPRLHRRPSPRRLRRRPPRPPPPPHRHPPRLLTLLPRRRRLLLPRRQGAELLRQNHLAPLRLSRPGRPPPRYGDGYDFSTASGAFPEQHARDSGGHRLLYHHHHEFLFHQALPSDYRPRRSVPQLLHLLGDRFRRECTDILRRARNEGKDFRRDSEDIEIVRGLAGRGENSSTNRGLIVHSYSDVLVLKNQNISFNVQYIHTH